MFRTVFYLRCGIGGVLSGLALLCAPELHMRPQGLVVMAVGLACIGIWASGIFEYDRRRLRKPAAGPTFDADDPQAQELAPTAAQLMQTVKAARDRQKRSRA